MELFSNFTKCSELTNIEFGDSHTFDLLYVKPFFFVYTITSMPI